MSTSEWIAIWALIISGAPLLTYLGQLVVLILVYRRVMKETDRNAEVRRHEKEKAGEMMQEQGKDTVRRLKEMGKRNTIGMSIMGVCLAIMLFANRAIVRKVERNTTKDR